MLTVVHARVNIDVPGAVRVLECHASIAGLKLGGIAAVQGQSLDLVVGEDNQLRDAARLLHNNLDVCHWHVVGKNLKIKED